jgi:hypothetical protein
VTLAVNRDRAWALATGVVTASLFFAAPASAATKFLYASPNGTTSGTNLCTNQSDPCSLPDALANANDGTDLTVLPGSYQLTAPISNAAVLFMHGLAGSPRPVIMAPSGGGMTAVKLGGAGGSLSHLDFQAGSGWQTVLEANFNLIEDITVTGTNITKAGLVMDPEPTSGSNLLRDSTVFVNTSSSGVVGIDIGGGSVSAGNADVRNVTTVETGTGSGGVGLRADNVGPGLVSVTAENVIASGTQGGFGATALSPGSTASLASDHSNFNGSPVTLGAGNATVSNTHPVSGAPLLKDMAHGDFHELPGSPTIDAGVDSVSNGANDPDGNLRTIGSATDVGAYEYAPPPSVTTLTPSSTAQTTATLTGSVNPNGAPTNVSFVLDSGPGTPQTVSTSSLTASASTQPVSQTVSGLTPGSTYTYHVHASNSGGPADGGEVTFTTPTAAPPPGGGGGGGVPPAPRLTKVSLSHRRFRVGRSATAVAAAAAHKKAPAGTSFRFTLNTAATLKIVITHVAPGRRSHGRCVKPSRKLAHAKRCRRKLTDGTLTRHPASGQDRVPFSGRIGRKPLPPGRYTAALTAIGPGGRSATVKLSFTVVRR